MADPLAESDRVLWHYVVTRSCDPAEVQVVNLAHAIGESVLPEQAPLRKDTRLCWLQVKDEAELREYLAELARKGISHAAVFENDEPYVGQLMAIALAPTLQRSKMRKIFHHLPLASLAPAPPVPG